METLKRLGLMVGLSALLVACGTKDADSVISPDNPDAKVTVEDVSESLELQTEVWEETDEETGEEFEVTLVKHVENGKVIRSSESREPISSSEEVEGEDKTTPTGISGKDIGESERITNIEADKVIITGKDGEVVEELSLEELSNEEFTIEVYEGTEEE